MLNNRTKLILALVGSLLVGVFIGCHLGGHHSFHRGGSCGEHREGMESKRGGEWGDRKGDDSKMGMDHSMMMVKSEKEFITEMIPHHEEAVETAKEVLARGATKPEIKTLVENIISAQEKEIADMKSWHQAWYGEAYQPSGNYKPMMRDLENLSGKDIDQTFLEDMVHHHMGAIMMAKSVESHITHDELRDLTKAIITSQTNEIDLMKELRAGL